MVESTKRPLTKRLVIIAILSLVAITASPQLFFITRSYLKGEPDWDTTPRNVKGVTVFEPHYSAHPGHYTLPQKISIATKIDVFGMLTEDAGEKAKYAGEAATYPMMAPIGEAAPDFELETTAGTTIRLSDKRGKIGVFMFVAMTCPPARTQVPLWTALEKKYDKEEVDMFFVYSRERHPGEPGYREFQTTETYEQRMAYAKMMSALTDVPIVVDGVDEAVLATYGMCQAL